MAGGNQSWYGGITDILSKGADLFLSKEYSREELKRSTAAMETERALQQTASQGAALKQTTATSNMIYIGVALVAVTLFVGFYKSL